MAKIMKNVLPKGWKNLTVNDVYEIIQTGTTPPKKYKKYYLNPEINWFSPSDFGHSKVLTNSKNKLNPIAIEERKARLYPSNSLLLVAIGATIGKIGIIKTPASSNQQITGIKFKDKVDVTYSYYWFKHIHSTILHTASTATLPIINQKGIKSLPFPLPPLPEQQRIVNKLDALFVRIDEAIQLVEANLELIPSLKMALLTSIFEKTRNLNQLQTLGNFDKIKAGGTPSRREKKYWNGTIPWFSSGELNTHYVGDSKEKITLEGLNNSSARLFKKDTLLIGMYDTAALKMSILTKEASCNQAIVGIAPDPNILNVEFLKYQLEYLRPALLLLRQGVRQKNLNATKIRNIEIAVPKIKDQLKTVNHINTVLQKLRDLKTENQSKLKHLQDLKKSLLEQAFQGKL